MEGQGQSSGFPRVPMPTVGRIVWYYSDATWRGALARAGYPLAALVAAVNDDGTLNLTVSDVEGNTFGTMNVPFRIDMTAPPPMHAYAVWPLKV